MKYIDKFRKFMYGRYGRIDELYKFLFYLYLIFLIINIFVKTYIITIIEFLIIFYMTYRFLSKKIYVRANENAKYLKIKKKLLKPFNNIKRNIKDKNYVYKKCHSCKKTLKLPVPTDMGIRYVKCPKCNNKNKFIVLKKMKVEVIRSKK